MDQSLKVTLNEMKQQLETKCKDLLQDCQEQLLGEEPEKQAVLGELKKEWSRKEKDFLDASENKYKVFEFDYHEGSACWAWWAHPGVKR